MQAQTQYTVDASPCKYITFPKGLFGVLKMIIFVLEEKAASSSC